MKRKNHTRRSLQAAALTAALMLPACSGGAGSTVEPLVGASATSGAMVVSESTPASYNESGLGAVGTLDSSTVHTISVVLDAQAVKNMIATYSATGEKQWIEAKVTIDGTTYERVGMRLKGNSSLRSVSVNASPESLPWLVRLDEFVDGQDHEGLTEFVVRSNSSATALNEAVALELLDLAGLASQDAIATAFSVNGSKAVLRLVIESPDSDWMEEEFADSGALYKAESTGDWSYRGTDPASYDNVFDQEAGKKNADLTPLIKLLEFLNNSDDATFKAQLEQWLDIDSFATYLAMQELLNNFDDIDGPGNNSYLYYDTATKKFSVVPWDYNLAFGLSPGGAAGGPGVGGGAAVAGAGGMAPGGQRLPGAGPAGANANGATANGAANQAPGGGGPRSRSNVLVQRFLANGEWQALYQSKLASLRTSLYTSGTANEVLSQWTDIVSSSNLVAATTIQTEAARIAQATS